MRVGSCRGMIVGLGMSAVLLTACQSGSTTLQASGSTTSGSGSALGSSSPSPSSSSSSSSSVSGSGANAPTTSTTSAAPPLLVIRAANGAVSYSGRMPLSIGFSADSTNVITHLSWSSWSQSGAVGNGTFEHNNCVPNCAQGTITPEAATVTLDVPEDGHFTTMTETIGTTKESFDYPANWALSAS
ncbi:MAG: hypothetical protein ACP5PJ_06745 [Acidimicrobiales bacterium]